MKSSPRPVGPGSGRVPEPLSAPENMQLQQDEPMTIQPIVAAPLDNFFRLAIGAGDHGLREALELRRALESETAALAAVRITRQQLAELERLMASLRRNTKKGGPWLDADYAFHMTLAKAADNALLLRLMEALSGVMQQSMRLLQAQSDIRDAQATLARHEAIYIAVMARDPARARAAMQLHFDATQPIVLAIDRDRSRASRV